VNRAAGIDLPNQIVDGIGNVEIAGGIEYNVSRAEEQRGLSRPSVARITAGLAERSGNGCNGVLRRSLGLAHYRRQYEQKCKSE
jgi:hypothetical protein